MLEEKNVKDVLNQFLGKQEQIPPIYSAIKVNGKKLYEYARKGESVEIKPRQIEIYEIRLNSINVQAKQIEFTVKCSKGTYIRSLCEDVALKLNTVGHMIGLERLQVGEFNLKEAATIKELEENPKEVEKYLLKIERLFEKYPSVELNDKKIQLLLNGVKLSTDQEDGAYKIYCNKEFIGIATVESGKLKRDIIIR